MKLNPNFMDYTTQKKEKTFKEKFLYVALKSDRGCNVTINAHFRKSERLASPKIASDLPKIGEIGKDPFKKMTSLNASFFVENPNLNDHILRNTMNLQKWSEIR